MSPAERLQHLEDLFHQVVDLRGAHRLAAAHQLCGNDRSLLSELLALLDSSESVNELLAVSDPPKTPGDRYIGQSLGPFRIDSFLAQGGMGLVFRAHHERLADQLAAVKISARGLSSETAVKQLFAERDMLAKLQHPHIARLLDAGVTGGKLPWIAMEFIEGRSIDRVADDPTTTDTQRFGYCLELCGALSFVHRHLLLHRDIKPSNVLVTGDGSVKLLDFGIAKAFGPAAHDSPLTEAGLRPLTLQYASPEHIRGGALTTATDIYSLGILLRRLFANQITLDLDEIFKKATRIEPDQRYATVDEFAADLVAARDGLPVRAYRGNIRYRVRKFVRRHQAAVGISSAALAALVIALTIVAYQARLQHREQIRAEASFVREEMLAHMLLFDFFDRLKSIPGSTEAQRRTVSNALDYLDKLNRSTASSGTALASDLIEAYTDFGNLLGSPYEENLGEAESAKRTLTHAITLARKQAATAPNDLIAQSNLARAEMSLARIYFGSGDPESAIRFMQPAADLSDRIAADPHATSAQIAQAASALDALADVEFLPGAPSLNNRTKALAAVKKAQSYHEKGYALDSACDRCHRGIVVELWKRGVLEEETDPARSAASLRAGMAAIAAFPPEEQKATRLQRLDTLLRAHLGTVELNLGHPASALASLVPAQKRLQRAIVRDPIDSRARFDLVAMDIDLANAWLGLGKRAQAARVWREVLTNCDALLSSNKENVQWQITRARALVGLGNVDDGLRIMIPLARKKDASVEVLSLTAESLVDHPQQQLDTRALAIEFAQRAVDASPSPTPAQYTMLHRARNAK